MKRDGHIHTPFCPHGTKDALEGYVLKAIQNGFTHITFTEHAPLPENFVDPTPNQDSGMDPKLLDAYFSELQALKMKYKTQINIHVGFEIDYIEGFEKETTDFLNTYGPQIDDAILSVHFLRHNDTYTCIDFSEDVFLQFAETVGSVEDVYALYYQTVEKSIEANLGCFKPKRIGHPTLVHKFQLAHETTINDDLQIKHILQLLQKNALELDVNSAGLNKKYCLQPYPPLKYVTLAKTLNIPLVFGSDAHQITDLHKHYELFEDALKEM